MKYPNFPDKESRSAYFKGQGAAIEGKNGFVAKHHTELYRRWWWKGYNDTLMLIEGWID